MLDQYNRNIDYLRISVTDRCNLRCRYCMPDGIKLTTMAQVLTFEEITRIARAGASLGIRHVRLTGGEPLVRRGVTDLVRMLHNTDGIEEITMTTNGVLLAKYLDELIAAGLGAVNISLDSVDRETYERITGKDALEDVLAAVDAACRSGIPTKVNAVSLGLGEEAVRGLIFLSKDRPLDVRFIEMMPIGYGKTFPVYSHQKLKALLQAWYPGLSEDHAVHGYGPAVYYRIPGYRGSIGLISAIHGKFCSSCNRVRLTSQGFLKSCLCYDHGADLREILRMDICDEKKDALLVETMRRAIYEKPEAHCFEEREMITECAPMSAIGG